MFRLRAKAQSKTRKPSRLVAGFIAVATTAVAGTTGIAAAQASPASGSGYGGPVNNNNINVSIGNITNSVVNFAIHITNSN